jgi:hypothetical protein
MVVVTAEDGEGGRELYGTNFGEEAVPRFKPSFGEAAATAAACAAGVPGL